MNKFRRIIVFILTLALCFQVTVPALAANSIGVTYEAIFDKTEVYTSSEDQTITLTIRANKVIEMDSLSAKAAIPEGFELINMVNEDIGLTSANGNLTTGVVGWYQSDSETVSSQNLVILTYKVPAGTLAGTYDFRFYIDTISSYWEIWEDGNTTVPATLTILEAAEEECDHQDKEYIYDDNDDGTHKVTCECGETIAEAEPHDYTTGTADNTCICGAAEPVELVEVTVYFIDATPYGDGIEVDEEDAADGTFYHTFYANPDEDLVVDVKPMGDWPYVGYDIWDDGGLTDEWISADGVTQLVVPKEWFDYEGRWIEVYGHSYDVIDLNGGALGEGFPEEWLDGYDSETNTLKLAVGSRTSWTPAMLGFEREGYTLVGAESGETTFGMEDDIEAVPEGRSLKLIWKADHVCAHDHYEYYDATGHQSVCSCSELIGEAEAHDYTSGTAEHTCICGKVEEFTLSISTFNEKGEGVQEEIDVPFGAKLADYYLDTPDYVSSGLLHEFQSWIAWTWENQDDATMAEYTGDTMPASDVNMYSTYTFTGWVTDENGTAYYVKSEIQKTGKTEIDGAWYYLDPETGIRAESKLFVLEDGYYYAKPTGQLAVSGDCYVVNPDKIEKDGEVIAEGTYTFDAEGRIIWPEVTDKNGIYKEADGLYYYVDGERTYAGLIEYTGHLYNEDGSVYEADAYNADYIYVRTSGILATGKLWITKNNGKLPSTNYNFDAEGRMDRREGFIQEGEETYYYENGNRTHKGLMLKDGSFYYVNSSGLVIANRTYWITFTNGFEETHGIVEGSYQFSADGKMIIPEVKNGIYEEDGKLVFYKNDSKPCYAGLIRYTGDLIKEDGTVVAGVYNNNWIYVRTSGEVATGKLWITKNNGEMPSASYNFDVYGRMKNGIYEEGQNLMYYQDGNLVYAGLINYTGDLIKEDGTVVAGVYDGAYIYVRTGGKLARDVKYWPTITNDNWVITHQHTFDSNGVMLDPDI